MIDSINNQTQIPTKSIVNKDGSVHQSKIKSESGINKNMDTVTLTQNQEAAQTYSSTLTPVETADKGFEMLAKALKEHLKRS